MLREIVSRAVAGPLRVQSPTANTAGQPGLSDDIIRDGISGFKREIQSNRNDKNIWFSMAYEEVDRIFKYRQRWGVLRSVPDAVSLDQLILGGASTAIDLAREFSGAICKTFSERFGRSPSR